MLRISSNEELLINMVHQAPVPVLITDTFRNIVYINSQFTNLTGYSVEDVLGKNPRILSAGKTPPQVYKELWDTVFSGGVWQGDLLNRRKDGEEFWESIAISPIRNKEGAVTHFVGIWQDSTQRKHHLEDVERRSIEFERQAITDDLTGIYNRRFVFSELEREIERAKRYNRPFSGMMIDVDDFKKINDQYGHPIGDRVLRTLAAVLKQSLRKVDVLGRYGGDEFLVVLPETKLEAVKRAARRIQKNLADYEENVIGGLSHFTVSIGLFSSERLGESNPKEIIEKIDEALLKAKQAGKNKIIIESTP